MLLVHLESSEQRSFITRDELVSTYYNNFVLLKSCCVHTNDKYKKRIKSWKSCKRSKRKC